MNDSRIDWGSLMWAIANEDLSLEWHFGQSATRGRDLESAPVKAHLFWKVEGATRCRISLTKLELDACIERLEREGLPVPAEFREVLRQLPPEHSLSGGSDSR